MRKQAGSPQSFLAGLVALAIVACASEAGAAYTWQVPSGDWSAAANWGGTTPTINDDAYVLTGTASVSTSAACNNLYVDGPGSLIALNSGTFTTGVSRGSGDGTEFIGYSGVGNFLQTGGVNTVNQYVPGFSGNYGLALGWNSGSSGTYTMSGGQVNLAGESYGSNLRVGYSGSGTFNQSAGTVSISDNNYPTLMIAQQPGSSGIYNFSGGLITINGGELPGGEQIGNSGSGTMTQSGGTNNSSGGVMIGGGAGSSGVYNLEGGVLAVGYLAAGSGSATFNFSGGTLQALGSFSPNVPMTFSGAANFNTQGNALTFTAPWSGSGALMESGTGTITFASSGSYSGPITISSGTLATSGSGALGTGGVYGGNLNIAVGGIFNYAGSAAQTLGANILGSGNLVQSSGLLTLAGSTQFAGNAIVSGGTLVVAQTFALQGATLAPQTGGNVSFAPGVTSPVLGALQGSGSISLATASGQPVTLNVGQNGQSTAFNGALTGPGSLVKTGSGTLSLSPGSSYTGPTTIQGGVLQLLPSVQGLYEGLVSSSNDYDTTDPIPHTSVQPVARWGASTSTGPANNVFPNWGNNTTWGYTGLLDNASGGSLTYTFGKNFDDAAYLSIDGQTVIGNTNYNSYPTASITLAPGLHAIDLRFGQGVGAVGPIAGVYGQYGIGYNTVGNASQSGTWVQMGASDPNTQFYVTAPGNFGLTSPIVMFSNTTLDVSMSSPTGVVVSLASLADAPGGPTGHQVLLGTNTLQTGSDNSSTTFSGTISGSGNLVKQGTGVFTLAGANIFGGTTTVAQGSLLLANPLALQGSTLDTSGSGALSFGTLTAATLGGITGPGAVNLANTSAAGVVLSVGNNGGNTTYSGALQGPGSFAKIGAGALVLSGSNTYLGGTSIDSGVLEFAIPAALPSGNVAVSSGATIAAGYAVNQAFVGRVSPSSSGNAFTVALAANSANNLDWSAGGANLAAASLGAFGSATYSGTLTPGGSAYALGGGGGTLTVASALSGNYGMNVGNTGSGTVVLTNSANNWSGPTNVAAGSTLQIGNGISGGATMGGSVVVNGALTFNGPATQSLASGIGGTGQLNVAGPGLVSITGSGSFSGSATVSGGTLQLGNGTPGHDGSLTGNIVDNAALVYNLNGSQTYAGSISGSGELTKTGPGTLMMAGTSSYSGPTNVLAGTLVLNPGPVVPNGILAHYSFNGTTTDVSGNGNNGTAVNGPSYVAGPIASVNAMSFNGSNQYVLVPYSPSMALNSWSVSAWVEATSSSSSNVGNGIVGTRFGSSDETFDFKFTTGTNKLYTDIGNGSSWLLTGAGDTAALNYGSWYLVTETISSSGGYSYYVDGNPAGSGTIGGTPLFIKSGGSIGIGYDAASTSEYFNGSIGDVYLFNRTLSASDAQQLYESYYANSGLPAQATLQVAAGATVDLNGTNNQLAMLSGSGTITNGNASQQSVLTLSPTAGALTFGGSIQNGAGGVALAVSGPVTLAGADTFSGPTTVSAGTLTLAHPLAAQNSTVSVNSGAALAFAAGNTAPTLGGLSGSGNIALATAASEPVSLSVGNNGQSTTFGGTLSGPGSLVKTGSGTLSLMSWNSYTGPTIIQGGTLKVYTAMAQSLYEGLVSGNNSDDITDPIPHTSVQPVARWGASNSTGNGTYPYWANDSTWGYAGYLDNTSSSAVTYTFGKNFDDAGYLAIDGQTIINDTSYNSYPTASITLAPGLHAIDLRFGQYTFTVGPNINAYGRYGIAYNTVGNSSQSGTWVQIGASDPNTQFFTTPAGSIGPASPVIMYANTTLDLSALSPSGTASIASLADGPGAPSGAQVLLGGNFLAVGQANSSTTFSGSISGSGGFIKQGSGVLNLNGPSTFTGQTTVAGGTLQLGDGTPGHDGSLIGGSIVNNAALVYNLNGNQTYGGAISGSGAFTKTGPGNLTLSEPSYYTGPTVVAGGTLALGNGPLMLSSVNLAVGGAVSPSGSYSLGGGSMTISGDGTDFWGPVQQGTFVYKSVPTNQNFDVAVHISTMSGGDSNWAKAGIMARQDASNNNVNTLLVAETTAQGITAQWTNASQYLQAGSSVGPNWLRMTYNAATGTFVGYESPSTSTTPPTASDPSWVAIESFNVPMIGSTFDLGIADSSHQPGTLDTAQFDNVAQLFPLANILPATTPLSLAASATVDLEGTNQTLASLADFGGSGGKITNSGAGLPVVLTLSPSGGSTTFSGSVQNGAGGVSLTLAGSGIQVFAGSNTYTGPTTINHGTLTVNGSLISPVSVNSGGVLSGTGSLANVTIDPSGQLSPGSPLGAMQVSGSLSLLSGAVMDYDLDTPADSSQVLMSGGTLVLSGQQFSDFNFTPLGGFGPGTYDLVNAGTIIGSLGQVTGGTIDGIPAALALDGNELVLNVVPEPRALWLLVAALAPIGILIKFSGRWPSKNRITPH